jgi:hypothetical protein
LLANGSVTTCCTIVSECLKAGLVDTIWKRPILGNGQRRFYCNDIGKQLFPKKRRQTFPAQRRCFCERINSTLRKVFCTQSANNSLKGMADYDLEQLRSYSSAKQSGGSQFRKESYRDRKEPIKRSVKPASTNYCRLAQETRDYYVNRA